MDRDTAMYILRRRTPKIWTEALDAYKGVPIREVEMEILRPLSDEERAYLTN